MKRLLISLLAIVLSSTMAVLAFAQTRGGFQVRGEVHDATGPVIGATVVEQGTTNGTSTGIDGDFVLQVSSADAIVEISCIGYATQSFRASAVPARILLVEDSEFLDETVVIGYGTVKKSDMTGSVTALKAEEIARGAINTPDQLLLGKVAGLRIIPGNGQGNSTGTIRIRGTASLSASNDPLIVIDGVPGGSLSSVNSNDIENFSVLKDASATAIYGSRASNGVIIITTKKGNPGRGLSVSYNGSFSAKTLTNFYDWMDGDELRTFINETYPEKAEFLGTENTDFMKYVYRIAINHDHNLSIRGGGKFPFRVSLGFNQNQPNSKVGDNKRYTANATFSPKFLDKHLSVDLNGRASYSDSETSRTGAIGGALSFNPTVPAYEADGKTIWNWRNSDGSALTMGSSSPLSTLYDSYGHSNSFRVSGSLQLNYKVHGFEDLSFNVNTNYNTSWSKSESWTHHNTYTYERDTNPMASRSEGWGGHTTLFEAYANYQHEFNFGTINAMAGYSWQHFYNHSDGSWSYLNQKDYDVAANRWLEEDIYTEPIPSSSELYLISFYGRINYSYKSKYLFTFTLRDDASSRFSPKTRWGLFPSVAFAWNMGEEPFIKNIDAISSMKLRLGWGETGQQDIGSDYYAYLARYAESTSPIYMLYNMGDGNYPTLSPRAYNPNIKWETTGTYNIGLDFGFLRERITGTLEGYYRYTYDLLNTINVPLGSNFSNVVTSNIGNMVNKGIEFSLNTIPIETRDWHWNLGANVTFQDTKITKLTAQDSDDYLGVQAGQGLGGTGGYSSLHSVGYAPYTFYMYEQLYDKNGNPIENGLVDRNGDGVINDADRYRTPYSPNPWMFFGFNTKVTYKQWDFSINGHGSVGNHVINTARKNGASTYSNDVSYGYLSNINKELMIDGWTLPASTEQGYSDYWIENASFLKIDDINLGYTFKPRRFVRDIRVAASIQNVCTFTKFKGLDPEVTSLDGVDGSSFPRPTTYTLRLNINF